MKTPPLRALAGFFLAGAAALLFAPGCLATADRPVSTVTIDFEACEIGAAPPQFSTALTGGGGPVSWIVLADPNSSHGGRVLAQMSTDNTNNRFPLCLYEPVAARDVSVSVRFRPISGKVDQAAGLVVRCKDKDNYYVVRANALENNVRFYKVEAGKRKQLATADVEVASGKWQGLALTARGSRFSVLLNGKPLFAADAATFGDAGKVGLWTKADSVTHFDHLEIRTYDTP
jgi:hypothetical protein